MSTAHRPTWDPAQGKDSRLNSRVYSSRDLAAHTRLKFRQPGQGNKTDVARRDLKLELLAAERESSDRKAKGQSGYVPDRQLLLLENQTKEQDELDEANNRRRVLADVAKLDRDDDDDDEEDDDGDDRPKDKGKGKAVEDDDDDEQDEDDEDESDSDDDDEDETAELLRELEKIKRERAEEKERLERERAANESTTREEEIAVGNPLLNLQAALGASPTPSAISTSTGASTFGVKRRWDDDLIFKNQARDTNETPKAEFVNDLLRTNYHRRFMKRHVG
ncbi:BQ2448_736 [Microbotryum intermedium]|uniref:BQ2448_736 protein n=1 Tax=Microbotryum intermedium TaxID=269621 RepID=A0A238F624_9BASI|nr:BQ2448_736 [Microbotryum intermedium]